MMDVIFAENEIKKDIEECLKYYGFKNTSLCEHKVYVSKLDNLMVGKFVFHSSTLVLVISIM